MYKQNEMENNIDSKDNIVFFLIIAILVVSIFGYMYSMLAL